MDPVTSAAGGLSYPDSVESSPRSRGGESWDEPFPSAASQKLRLMCSYGGRIVPRPTDKSLCYLGGDTRIVVVDRLYSLSDLHSKLSRSLLNSCPFTLKYQLPNEDLDSLISVTTDEDLENMIEEYDRIGAAAAAASSSNNSAAPNSGSAKSSRIRLFLFPTKPESAPSSIGSLLDDSKTETWFVDALNGTMGIGIDGLPRDLSTDSASVNCLLGLEDDSSVHSRAGVGSNVGGDPREQSDRDPDRMVLPRPDSSGKLGRHGQDVHSVPDSPMLETSSSFGSTNSAPSLSNLPPIRVRQDDRPPDSRYGNLDDRYQQMNLSSAAPPPAINPQPQIPMPTAAGSTPSTVSLTENPNPNRVFGSEEEKPDIRKQPPMPQQVVVNHQQQQQQQKPVQVEAPISDSRPVYYQERMPPPAAVNPEPKRETPVSDPGAAYRMQQVTVPESGYVMPTIPAPQQLHPHLHPHQHQQQLHMQQHPQQHPQQQQQQQQQQQFIPANPQFVQMSSYYQMPHPMQQAQQFDPSVPMYYLPVRQNPPTVSAVPLPKVAPKPELQHNLYRTAAPPAPMIHVAAQPADQGHPAYTNMGYHVMHHHHPSQAPAATAAAAAPPPQMANYGYEYTSAAASTVDTMHPAQVYYTQTTSPPSMQAQYQTVISEAAQQTVEVKQNRAS